MIKWQEWIGNEEILLWYSNAFQMFYDKNALEMISL